MLSFVVMPDDGVAPDPGLAGAYLFGGESAAMPSRLSMADGVIRCDRPGRDSAGLCLPVAVRPAGGGPASVLLLSTCLLPDRDGPYLLNLELARRRIMALLTKIEDWGLFDLPADHAVSAAVEQARRAFAEALVAPRRGPKGFSPEASAASSRALRLAVDAGELLAGLNAERQLAARLTGRAYRDALTRAESAADGEPVPAGAALKPADGVGVIVPGAPALGCALTPGPFSEAVAAAAAGAFDFLAVPMRWVDLEPREGTYSFAATDRWIEWAVRTARVPVVGGPVIDLRKSCIPEWLAIWENDYETLRDLVFEHVKQVVTRYRRAVGRWTIASGLNVNDNISLAPEQVIDLTRVCLLVVRKLQPAARVQLEITRPWGEYAASGGDSMQPLDYAKILAAAGITADSISIRLQMGTAAPGCATRDMLALSDLLDRFAEVDRPVTVTALGAPSRGDAPAGGSWRGPWTPESQAAWLDAAVRVCIGKPFVQGVCWHELADGPATPLEGPGAGLIDAEGRRKPAFSALAAIRAELRASAPADTQRPGADAPKPGPESARTGAGPTKG